MHKFIFFDTETTSLLAAKNGNPGGEVIQFAAIIVNSEFKIERVINRYCNTNQRIDPGAYNVHNISKSRLEELSESKTFEAIIAEEGLRNFDNATWIAHNIDFDVRMARQTSIQNGFEPINFGAKAQHLDFKVHGVFKYDTMSPLSTIHKRGYRVKLETLIHECLNTEKFYEACRIYIERGIQTVKSGNDHLHNAFFDTLGLMLLVRRYKNLLLR